MGQNNQTNTNLLQNRAGQNSIGKRNRGIKNNQKKMFSLGNERPVDLRMQAKQNPDQLLTRPTMQKKDYRNVAISSCVLIGFYGKSTEPAGDSGRGQFRKGK